MWKGNNALSKNSGILVKNHDTFFPTGYYAERIGTYPATSFQKFVNR
jgi:hypothetical protein